MMPMTTIASEVPRFVKNAAELEVAINAQSEIDSASEDIPGTGTRRILPN